MLRKLCRKGLSCVLAALALSVLTGCTHAGTQPPDPSPSNPPAQSSAETALPTDSAEEKEAPFSLTMLDVGQGLAILVQADGKFLLYDGGGRETSSYVVAYLQQHGVAELDWLVASHYDEDHISGLVGVLHTTPVEQALMPDYTADTQIFQSLQQALREKSVPIHFPTRGDIFSLGGAELRVTGPQAYTYEDENNNSLCLQIRYEQFSCLLTGDAEREAEHDMVASGQDLACDVYVVGHHGSASSTGDELLRAAAPTCAFLSVGAGNLYGHPAEQTLAALRRQGTALYRTDVQGEVTVFSDGQQCWFSTVPCEDWRAGTGTAAEEPLTTVPPQAAHYLLNTHTQKFHSPDCPSGEQMKEENKAFTDATREELIARGYTPCGRCNP